MKKAPAYLTKLVADSRSPYDVPMAAQFPRISMGNNRFTAVAEDGTEEVIGLHSFDFIVLAANPALSRVYYDSGYDPNVVSAPTCYSDNGAFPDVRVSEPQSIGCANCPQAAWGSSVSQLSGKKTKACSEFKKLLVYVLGDKVEGLYQFRVAPASLKAWATYVKDLRTNDMFGDLELTPEMVVTRAKWDKQKQNVLTFELVDVLDEESVTFTQGEKESTDYTAWLGIDAQSQERPQALAAPVNQPRLSAPKAQAKEVPEPVDAEYEDTKPALKRRMKTVEKEPEKENVTAISRFKGKLGKPAPVEEDEADGEEKAPAPKASGSLADRVREVTKNKIRAGMKQ